MERRDFLKLASLAGLAVVVGPTNSKEAEAAEPYTGPLWLMINAGGGWDPTSMCDPKGGLGPDDPKAVNRLFTTAEIQTIGAFQVPPPNNGPLSQINQFFQDHYQNLLVINGIDTQTNSHDVGSRTTWTGSLTDGRPAFAALLAAAYGATLPMGFITNGGYDNTAGIVPSARVGNIDAIQRAAYPNVLYPPDNPETFHSDITSGLIAKAREDRHNAVVAKQRLTRIKKNMNTLYAARTGSNELKKLLDYLPDLDAFQTDIGRQAAFAMAAYQADICVAANLDIGGFDTHGQHDNNQLPQLAELLAGVGEAWSQAGAVIGGNVRILVGSDFGRTPMYNDGDGKDHWNITSMLMMGTGIPGNKLFGVSDPVHNAVSINEAGVEDPNGFTLHPGHIHIQLRKLAGIDQNEVVKGSLLNETEEIALFS